MSQQEVRAAKATHETCRNCKRWHDWGDDMGRCMKFTRRIVMTFGLDTCENFSEKKEVKKL